MRAPELTPTAEKIDKILNRINAGDIRIPAFQRSYVWKQEQIIDLLDSIVKNYPIGSVLLWSTDERLKHTRNIAGYAIPDTALEYPVNYVLDGQQRISSIYATFSDSAEQDAATAQYNPNLDLFEIYYDFATKSFLPKSEVDINCNHVIYLRNFIKGASLIAAMKNLDEIYHDEAQELYSKFINYELPVVTIKNRSKSEVGIIFERINNTGTKLTTLDLMTAWTWTDDFHLLEQINELLSELEEKNFGDISRNILLQALSAVIQDDTTTKTILELQAQTVRDNWDKFCEALRKAIDFLSSALNCSHQDFLPYQQQLVGLTKFFSIAGFVDATQLSILKKWFWKTSFSNRYSTGQTTTKMNADIETIKAIRNGEANAIDEVKYSATTNELINTKFSKGNPLTRSFLLLMAQMQPKDLLKNVSIDITTALSEYNRKQYHHIFPNAFLRKQGFPTNKIFSVVNFCFLTAESNKKITKKSPSDYFVNLIPQGEFNDILGSNLIPLKKELYTADNYNDFLAQRAVLVLQELDRITN